MEYFLATLGIVLLGGMIASAVRMINASRDTVADYIHAENVLAERSAASSLDGTLTFKDGAGQARKLTDASSSAAGTDIVYYVNEVIPATTVAAYRKDE